MKKVLTAFSSAIYAVQLILISGAVVVVNTGNSLALPLTALLCAVSVLATLVMGVISIVYAGCSMYRDDPGFDCKTVSVFKLVNIPFFMLNFGIWLFVTMMILTPMFIGAIWLLPLGVGYAYFVMLATSLPMIFYIFKLKCDNEISFASMTLHIILQLIFVLDIVDALYWLTKKRT